MDPLEYFREQAAKWKGFQGQKFHCEDKNLLAFESLNKFIAWYGQPPSPGEHYRDDGFYTRELATVSMNKPGTIVEIGTALGIGTIILAMLNPDAEIVTLDNRELIPAGDGCAYTAGHLAAHNGAKFKRVISDSKSWSFRSADLYFIDGDHSYGSVKSDSEGAWGAGRVGARIIWHDYNDRHPGCMQAVDDFCRAHELVLKRLPDSCTVWTSL